MAIQELDRQSPDGTRMGTTSSSSISFFGASVTTQPASSSQASVSATTTTTATTTALETDLDAVRTLVNRMRADLVTLGLIKGSA